MRTQRMSGPSKKVNGLISLMFSLLASQGREELDLKKDKVPVSYDPYLHVTFGFTSDLGERIKHGRDLGDVRKALIAAVEARGYARNAKDPIFRDFWELEDDGHIYRLEISGVTTDFYQPFFRVQPWVDKKRK